MKMIYMYVPYIVKNIHITYDNNNYRRGFVLRV